MAGRRVRHRRRRRARRPRRRGRHGRRLRPGADRDGEASARPRQGWRSTSGSATPRAWTSTTRASTSSRRRFGVMFAPDQPRAAAELARVTRPGAQLALATWVPDGGIGEMFTMPAPFQPPLPDGPARRSTGAGRARRGAARRCLRAVVRDPDVDRPGGERRGVLAVLRRELRPGEDARRVARRRSPRGVPPGLGRLLRNELPGGRRIEYPREWLLRDSVTRL